MSKKPYGQNEKKYLACLLSQHDKLLSKIKGDLSSLFEIQEQTGLDEADLIRENYATINGVLSDMHLYTAKKTDE